MDREAWPTAVHGVAESDMTELSNWTDTNQTIFFFSYALAIGWMKPYNIGKDV